MTTITGKDRTVRYSELANTLVSAANGVDYAYRDTGPGDGVPLVLLQHFRGNLDNWDPALIDALAADRRVVTFDYAGVGGSTGKTAHTAEQMAHESIAFIEALDLGPVDLLGFSIGSFVAQQIALTRPAIVRRVVLASAAPQGAAGMHGWAAAVIGAIGAPQTSPDHALLQRLSCLQMPVFVANGDSDPMILPHYSYLLAGLIPQAQLKIYPDSAHGFLFQHNAEFATDVRAFLSGSG
jgi:pimeloyl-ACP methyl ester carboxylesterase